MCSRTLSSSQRLVMYRSWMVFLHSEGGSKFACEDISETALACDKAGRDDVSARYRPHRSKKKSFRQTFLRCKRGDEGDDDCQEGRRKGTLRGNYVKGCPSLNRSHGDFEKCRKVPGSCAVHVIGRCPKFSS